MGPAVRLFQARRIVDNLTKPSASTKTLIPLSLGLSYLTMKITSNSLVQSRLQEALFLNSGGKCQVYDSNSHENTGTGCGGSSGCDVCYGKIRTDILATIKDDLDLTQKLLDEESVFVLPGQCFGIANYFRIVFSAPHEVLADAFIRLAKFCYRHQ
ncbi:unnamed protein product [Peronospora belbahrii]|uniref:Aminotransferase class I/classII large domain-containing protein n=1 Tax=Peronospora belbahrii TaxID=622444 RepID=A0ABN8D920_9STRA|nr:unnamed protein product [Peronospora belbahrii]